MDVESVLGNEITDNKQLDVFMDRYPKINYIGAYDKKTTKKLIPTMKNNSYLIGNTKNEGEHWFVVYKYNKNRYITYDSFGRNIKQLINYKNPNLDFVSTLPDREQQSVYLNDFFEEVNCGARSIAWIIFNNKYGLQKGMLI